MTNEEYIRFAYTKYSVSFTQNPRWRSVSRSTNSEVVTCANKTEVLRVTLICITNPVGNS